MTSIYFGGARVKAYSATTKAGKSLIRVELETSDHYELASLLRQLDEIDAEQKAAKKKKPEPASKPKPLALPAPLLAIPYLPEDR